ncbi:ABC-F type ribosomal protection protein [Clostridium botulinum]|uniref:ABC-F type ribosomal protection protein n=1 Tax=Clostridium botulinum TaxID=1491 RepID=A0A6B4JRK3_CLOBO|nr:ABC-F type ribosomal protection protein CplR [Clostridium botulinum]EES49160.1 ABC transporter, ATP-binding protein [Clostridium botulinum E1 str. 'BoNT E Beluga']MBY6761680.1 ABC-F type ribosomal protection protein [Clostridium botulinum]MBY6921666.1 ABC-F type ribosomal protection protein [Clostridium botulinum]MCR1132641.1 ABC-F type ribosomal protection protein [Clostridium botulinum]NFH69881.1 ABC-F type ribosomal protection protein [Clostridium botulinum]
MVLIKLDKVKKYYGDKLILDIDNLEILENDRIGIVGENGAGKTTLIKVILGEVAPDEGKVFLSNSYSYISQSKECSGEYQEGKIKKILKSPDKYNGFLSGGEKMKIKINKALNVQSSILIADEPTANLDTNSIKNIEKIISDYRGSLLLVSHDRDFLDKLCNNILEIENGKVKLYKGNYSKYIELKAEEHEVEQREYYGYIAEKKRLEKAIIGKENNRDSIRKTPKRMGNSEARLHKMGNQKSKKNLDGNIKSLKSRINHLEEKEKPNAIKEIRIRINKGKEMHSKTVIEVRNLNLYVNNEILINDCNFKIKKGEKVAITGANGCGKTTLIKKIIKNNTESIRLSQYISIGYFDQNQDILHEDKSILDNIRLNSSYDETFIRINLDGFGFKGDTVYKNVSTLSGGEKVKCALCKNILSDNNTLILDEPTNYLDIKSIEALETAIKNTEKTVLIVSHDRKFISNVCNCIIEIRDNKLNYFNGNYNEFVYEKINNKNKKEEKKSEREKRELLLVLQNKLSEIISRLSLEKDLSIKDKLNLEYMDLLNKIKTLK